MKKAIAILAAVTVMGWSPPIQGGSIWDKIPDNRGPSSDDTARAIGDNITILVSEKSVIENESERGMNKKSDRSLKASGTVEWNNFKPPGLTKTTAIPTADLSSSAETKFKGDTKFDSSRSVVDEITVTVQDILPNGSLVVLGKRVREIHGDQEIVEVSGIVRPNDIDFDNKVLSTKVANFHVVYRPKGQEKLFTKPGWMDRILNVLNPF
jgi:flagellar L-ring protein precursor FlgH